MTTKLKKAKIVEKLAIKKKILKVEADIKKVDNQAAKNLLTTIKKLQIIKY